jgi:hypothetical protein
MKKLKIKYFHINESRMRAEERWVYLLMKEEHLHEARQNQTPESVQLK